MLLPRPSVFTVVDVANRQFVHVVCTGTVRLQTTDSNGDSVTILLRNVHYSPDFSHNLLSIDAIYAQHGISTHAAAAYCCKEIEFIRNLCSDVGVLLHGRLVLAVDNTASIDVAHDVGVSARTKHFDRAIHYFRDLTQLRRVVPTHVTTDLQRADGYTKSLSKAAFVSWMRCIYHD